ncbi:microtubule-associated protein futsch isoform X2 [Uranotaenia lowii]|uniref:microtubule-associated protein futsch isoform X2 n=1 Tax=Uranotaenia lowii TaxID=190385 RepID=UPI002479D4D6|nr:microtubule-associated protein futsch isoform X2 [Uranotaenia lowii]
MVVSKDGKRRRKVGSAVTASGTANATSSNSNTRTGTASGAGNAGQAPAGSAEQISASAAASRETPDSELSPEIPKRPKVQAQRKFAQGQGSASTSAYLTFATNPPTNPPKDGQARPSGTDTGPIPELLPNMRPNTEDFLTFLCFRGTQVLPPSLDFFNTAQQASGPSSNRGTVSSTSVTNPKAHTGNEKSTPATEQLKDTMEKKKDSTDSTVPKKNEPEVKKPETATIDKPAFMPFAVRKRAEQHPENRRVQTVQALRKKYHEQRMAKLRVTAYNKQTRTGNSRGRTGSEDEEEGEDEGENERQTAKQPIKENKNLKPSTAKKKQPEKNTGKKVVKNTKKSASKELVGAKIGLTKDNTETKNVNDNEEEKIVASKPNAVETPAKSKPKGSKKKSVEPIEETEKRTTRLSALKSPIARTISPSKSATPPPVPKSKTEAIAIPAPDQDFSSDDDEPLLKRAARKRAAAKTTNAKKGRKSEPIPEKTPVETPEKKPRRSESVSRKSDVSSKKSEVPVPPENSVTSQKRTPRSRKRYSFPPTELPSVPDIDVQVQVTDATTTVPMVDRIDSTAVNDTMVEQFTKTSPKKASGGRKKKVEPDVSPQVGEKKPRKTPEIITQSAPEINSRPSRKTKEAATLYMELIGRKLNHDDKTDDDASSLDSLELPNVRKLEQMENELKANVEKKESNGGPAKNNPRKKKETVKSTAKANQPKEAESKEQKVVEKSFSDSDEEPLASKFQRKKQQIRQKQKEKAKKASPKKKSPTKTSPAKDTVEKLSTTNTLVQEISVESKSPKPNAEERIASPLPPPKPPSPVKTPTKQTPPLKTSSPKVSTPQILSLPVQISSPEILRSPGAGTDDLNSTKVNKSHDNTFQSATAADLSISPIKPITSQQAPQQPFIRSVKPIPTTTPTDVPIEKPAPNAGQPEIPFNRNVKNDVNLDESDFLKGFEQSSPTSPVAPKTNSLLGNLLPSKEESEKIFGIASVSLAQSSGPLDTKCTLGKCGSVHKPPLGPPVLTESLLGGHLSPRDRRKTKVNMTHEQIQKWIDETSWSPIPDDIEGDLKVLEQPKTPVPTPPSVAWERLLESNKPEPIPAEQKPPTPVQQAKKEEESKPPTPQPSGSGSRGPTLKAKPVTVKPEKEIVSEVVTTPEETAKPIEPKTSITKEDIKEVEEPVKKQQPKIRTPSPTKKEAKKETRAKVAEQLASSTTVAITVSTTTTVPTATATATTPNAERKPIYKQGRTPVYKQEALKTSKTTSSASAANKFGAFSPDNEPSVYSFDNEDTFVPLATPFRRQSRRESCNSSARDEIQAPPVPSTSAGRGKSSEEKTNTFQKPGSVNSPSKTGVQPAVSVTLSPDDNAKSTAISVMPSDEKPCKIEESVKEEEKKTSADDSDDEGHTFYIPLQGPNSAAVGSKSDQVIQGVAVKLGTEGPEGPNQRVIMHAKLVTRAQMGSNTTPIPESMNVQELVKSLMAAGPGMSKDGFSKMVPVGTVQPRFKTNDSPKPNDKPSTPAVATTSTAPTVAPPPPTPPPPVPQEEPRSNTGLSRINSNSSLNSSQRSKNNKVKAKLEAQQIQPSNNTAFPRRDDPAQMVEAPVFKPTDKEFHDPIEYIERITPVAARFGICRIIPPASFKPECRISDDMRFMAYNQYVHKMLHRWGPSAKEYAAIKKYLATQSINLQNPPLIGGMEVDLPRLYHTVQELGGLKEVIEKKKWARVSEDMCIPKAAHDRVSKLDDIYCKYLLPYDTLSPAERQKLFDEVEADWAKREAKARRNADKCVNSEIRNSGDSDDEEEESNEEEEDDEFSMECIMKGRTMPLNQFFRIARNTMSLWFKNSEPTVAEMESEYWRHVAVRDSHVCVHSGSIDSSAYGFGFPAPRVKGSSCARHPWNLKVLTNNSGSILRSLGPVMGITIPTLHVGMLFSACCWYRDPHGLPWIEYLHTGANKIWYGIPDDQNSNFRSALTSLVPTHCQNKTIWLPCDTAMVPPHMLTDRNVSLCRTEQQPGQFVIVFPRAYTSSLCTGYAVSESVYFASSSWLDTAKDDFKDIQESCEPTMFSVEQLVFAIANDQRSNHDTVIQVFPMISDIYEKEKQQRRILQDNGVNKSEKIETKRKTASLEEFECDICRANLYLSLVRVKIISDDDDAVDEEERIYCLKHAIKFVTESRLPAKFCKLAYTYSLDDIEELLRKLQDRIAHKKVPKSGGGGGSSTGGGRVRVIYQQRFLRESCSLQQHFNKTLF